jgi:hypothetical protein
MFTAKKQVVLKAKINNRINLKNLNNYFMFAAIGLYGIVK